jgi:hypothetical protein
MPETPVVEVVAGVIADARDDVDQRRFGHGCGAGHGSDWVRADHGSAPRVK